MLLHEPDHRASRKTEHAGIPIEASGRDIVLGARKIRLFDESNHICPLGLDVAVAGFRIFRLMPNVTSLPLRSKFDGLHRSFPKRIEIADHMVGGEQQDDRVIAIHLLDMKRRNRRGSSRIAPSRLEQVGALQVRAQPISRYSSSVLKKSSRLVIVRSARRPAGRPLAGTRAEAGSCHPPA